MVSELAYNDDFLLSVRSKHIYTSPAKYHIFTVTSSIRNSVFGQNHNSWQLWDGPSFQALLLAAINWTSQAGTFLQPPPQRPGPHQPATRTPEPATLTGPKPLAGLGLREKLQGISSCWKQCEISRIPVDKFILYPPPWHRPHTSSRSGRGKSWG